MQIDEDEEDEPKAKPKPKEHVKSKAEQGVFDTPKFGHAAKNNHSKHIFNEEDLAKVEAQLPAIRN